MEHLAVKSQPFKFQVQYPLSSRTLVSAYLVVGTPWVSLVRSEHWRGTGLPTHYISAPHGVPVSGWLTDLSTHINHLIMPPQTQQIGSTMMTFTHFKPETNRKIALSRAYTSTKAQQPSSLSLSTTAANNDLLLVTYWIPVDLTIHWWRLQVLRTVCCCTAARKKTNPQWTHKNLRSWIFIWICTQYKPVLQIFSFNVYALVYENWNPLEKWNKEKTFLDLFLYLDPSQNWMVSSLAYSSPVHHISGKSVQYILHNPAERQTNKQLWKHNLLGSGNETTVCDCECRESDPYFLYIFFYSYSPHHQCSLGQTQFYQFCLYI